MAVKVNWCIVLIYWYFNLENKSNIPQFLNEITNETKTYKKTAIFCKVIISYYYCSHT
jgi:hypothetical protein